MMKMKHSANFEEHCKKFQRSVCSLPTSKHIVKNFNKVFAVCEIYLSLIIVLLNEEDLLYLIPPFLKYSYTIRLLGEEIEKKMTRQELVKRGLYKELYRRCANDHRHCYHNHRHCYHNHRHCYHNHRDRQSYNWHSYYNWNGNIIAVSIAFR